MKRWNGNLLEIVVEADRSFTEAAVMAGYHDYPRDVCDLMERMSADMGRLVAMLRTLEDEK